MFYRRATALLNELRGRRVGGWLIQDLINHGKSAAVFRATRNGCDGALKIFDAELVAQYGEVTQLTRIERELSLRNKRHEHLIRIFDGGRCVDTNRLFVAMQLIDGKPLSQALGMIPREHIPRIIQEVASAARFLEGLTMAHRDIKPDNIMYSPKSGKSTLLDLGVLRPINSVSTATDDNNERPFIGTLQYSPPEFLLREEEDSVSGWRAVTFYQLGAVLHDLIEQRPIFSEHQHPYARLVNAIQDTQPSFEATDVPHELILLAQNCLIKNWQTRLHVVNWEHFNLQFRVDRVGEGTRRRLMAKHADALPNFQPWGDDWVLEQRLSSLVARLHDMLRQWFVDQEFLPGVEISTSVNSVESSAALEMLIRSEVDFGLHSHLNVRLELVLLDREESVIELRVSACTSTEIIPWKATHYFRVFSGVMNELAILRAWEASFLPCYERAIDPSTPIGPIEFDAVSGQETSS